MSHNLSGLEAGLTGNSAKVEIVVADTIGLEQDDLDFDSEELEDLEEAAEEELAEQDDDENSVIGRLEDDIRRAAQLYPSTQIKELTSELKRHGIFHFMRRHVSNASLEQVQALLISFKVLLPESFRRQDTSITLLQSILRVALLRILRRRSKLTQYNTMEDAVDLLKKARNIAVLGGAGMSTSCGIPDFRSKDGIYAQLQSEGTYNLSDPQEMFDKDYFMHDPTCFFSFAHRIFPANFVPSPSHRFVKLLEDKNKLCRMYTQNIDTLEAVAGITRVCHCHGSFAEAQCTLESCKYTVPGRDIKEAIYARQVPKCPRCQERKHVPAKRRSRAQGRRKGERRFREISTDEEEDDDGGDALPGLSVLKPCITFFGEKLSDQYERCVLEDRSKVDLLIVIGTSLRVAPVSNLIGILPHSVPVILINKTPVTHLAMDIQLLGRADDIVEYLCEQLEWQLPVPEPKQSVVGESSTADVVSIEAHEQRNGDCNTVDVLIEQKSAASIQQPMQLDGTDNIWLFPGADPRSLVDILNQNGMESESDNDIHEDAQRNGTRDEQSQSIITTAKCGVESVDSDDAHGNSTDKARN